MWPPIRKFQTGGRSRKFPADNAERMQIAFALFANIVHIICKYVLHFIQFWTGQGLGQVVRIGPVRLSSGLICAPGRARIKTAQIWAPILSGRRQPPVSLCRVIMRQCAGAEAEILPPIWAFFVPREQFPVYSLNGDDNKQHVGLQARLRYPLGWLPGTIFPGISSEAES